MTKHFILPDCQVKPGHSTEYLAQLGEYVVDKKPGVVAVSGEGLDVSKLSPKLND